MSGVWRKSHWGLETPKPHEVNSPGPDGRERPRRKMHDFGDLGRALEMVALLPGVALGG